MNPWIVRGLGMAFVHVVTRVVLGIAITAWPLHGSLMRWLGIIVVVLAALVWAGIDGIRDARAHPAEGDEADLTMRWLKAAAVAGLLSGAVCWLVGAVSDIALGENSLFFELTSGAAFTLLLVFVPAMLAVAVGRFIAHRDAEKGERAAVAAPAQVPVAVGAAGAAEATDQWAHEDQWSDESGDGYGFAEGPYSDDNPTEIFRPAGHGDEQGRHHTDDASADTEVFRAVQPPKE
ncbi:B-4DMT family transporter [Rhodococcus sp. NPDC003322]